MPRSVQWLLALGAVSLSVACGKPDPMEENPWMRPGEDCLSCHRQGGEAEDKTWSAAGTVFNKQGDAAEGAKIFLVDASGRSLTLTSNGAGNFYTGETLTPPFKKIALIANGKTTEMPEVYLAGATGACNQCHTESGMAQSKLMTESP
jgi:hypothetical protein